MGTYNFSWVPTPTATIERGSTYKKKNIISSYVGEYLI